MSESAKPQERQLVFISHATPDDNDIAVWLSARLAALGYRTWVDASRLQGGERFWRDIQTAIRDQTIIFLALISKTSATREGVLNEISEAQAAGRRLANTDFIVPLRIDDLPWDDFPIQLKQLNGLDFSKDWAAGLDRLCKVLEKQAVPRGDPDWELAKVCKLRTTSSRAIRNEPETLISNWIPIKTFPGLIYAYHSKLSSEELVARRGLVPFPFEMYQRLLITFAEPEFVSKSAPADLGLELRYSIPFSEFLTGDPQNAPEFGFQEASKMAVSLIRQAWSIYADAIGLNIFSSGNSFKWFVPACWGGSDKIYFSSVEGKRSWRQLDGKALALHWHYAVSIKIRLVEPASIQLTPHVIFSKEGEGPLEDQKQLRRKHCKLWWNDKWRDLMLAFLAQAFKDAAGDSFGLPVGGSATLSICPRPMTFELPVTYLDDDAHLPSEEDADVVDRDADEPEEA